MTELPLLVVDVQRGGPSTGLPTKTEQADLLQAMYGRNGESPVPIIAPRSPADCFDAAIDAARIALTYRTPVLLLSDGAIANGSEPWRLPDVDDLPELPVEFATEPNGPDGGEFLPVRARPRDPGPAVGGPGHAGLEHRIGGLEKADGTGNISYDPDNHDLMVRLRQAKIDGIDGARPRGRRPDGDAEVWWSAGGRPTARSARPAGGCATPGTPVAQAHLRHLNPFPANLGEVLRALRTGWWCRR